MGRRPSGTSDCRLNIKERTMRKVSRRGFMLGAAAGVAANKAKHPDAKAEIDLRRVLDNKDINAVVISTCNHWHALAAVWACQAGKDVYVEKPVSENIWEGRKIVEAARKYKRIVQGG